MIAMLTLAVSLLTSWALYLVVATLIDTRAYRYQRKEKEMNFHTQLITTEADTCPSCGAALDLYSRPINVKVFVCCNCENEYPYEYMIGFRDGMKEARKIYDCLE